MSNEGKRVTVHYIGTFDDGEKFDSSYDRGEPIKFTCLAGQMIHGFDAAVRTMEVGETKNIRIEPIEGYGEYDPAKLCTMSYVDLPGSERLRVGQQITIKNLFGAPMPCKVIEKTETDITFDFNHEMAGKALNFEITLLEAEPIKH